MLYVLEGARAVACDGLQRRALVSSRGDARAQGLPSPGQLCALLAGKQNRALGPASHVGALAPTNAGAGSGCGCARRRVRGAAGSRGAAEVCHFVRVLHRGARKKRSFGSHGSIINAAEVFYSRHSVVF